MHLHQAPHLVPLALQRGCKWRKEQLLSVPSKDCISAVLLLALFLFGTKQDFKTFCHLVLLMTIEIAQFHVQPPWEGVLSIKGSRKRSPVITDSSTRWREQPSFRVLLSAEHQQAGITSITALMQPSRGEEIVASALSSQKTCRGFARLYMMALSCRDDPLSHYHLVKKHCCVHPMRDWAVRSTQQNLEDVSMDDVEFLAKMTNGSIWPRLEVLSCRIWVG